MKRFSLIALFLVCGGLAARAQTATAPDSKTEIAPGTETVFDVPALLNTPLNPKVLKTTEHDGIVTEEVMFHSENDGDKSVDIFGFFSYPKGAQKLPAFIWNQAGMAQANAYYPEFGAKRGYAALSIDFPLPGYRSTGGYPINSGLELGDDPRKAPIYHGAVALLKAVSYLESRPEVDKDRIGMAGSSWGGFYTTFMAGLDPRLKAASAMFGTGSLQLGNAWWTTRGLDDAAREHWRTTLDPAWRLPNGKAAMAWFTGTNDNFYWMPAMMQSYAMAKQPKHLTLLPDWDHGLPPNLDEQVFGWLDVWLQGKPAFLTVTPLQLQKQGKDTWASWHVSGPRQATSADLILSYGDDGNWRRRYWLTLPAVTKDGACTVKLPAGDVPYYISGSVMDKDNFRYSTPLVRVSGTDFAKNAPRTLLDYDGCSMWGDFEESQVNFLKANALPNAPVSTDARTGKQSVSLAAGTSLMPPILFTVGVPQVFRAYLKSDKPVTVTVELGGTFGKDKKMEQKQVAVGTNWTEVAIPFTPPSTASVDLQATITVPEGGAVLLDSVSFHPVWPGHR